MEAARQAIEETPSNYLNIIVEMARKEIDAITNIDEVDLKSSFRVELYKRMLNLH